MLRAYDANRLGTELYNNNDAAFSATTSAMATNTSPRLSRMEGFSQERPTAWLFSDHPACAGRDPFAVFRRLPEPDSEDDKQRRGDYADK